MTEHCANCHFALVDGNAAFCRRNPPGGQIVFLPGPQGQPPNMQTFSIWPPVRMEQWCGEWRKMRQVVMPTEADLRTLSLPAGTA